MLDTDRTPNATIHAYTGLRASWQERGAPLPQPAGTGVIVEAGAWTALVLLADGTHLRVATDSLTIENVDAAAARLRPTPCPPSPTPTPSERAFSPSAPTS